MDKENKSNDLKKMPPSKSVQPRCIKSGVKKPTTLKSSEKKFLLPPLSKRRVEKTKTSTPEKEESPSITSIDLSCISMISEKPMENKTKSVLHQGKHSGTVSEKQKNAAIQLELDKLYDEYLHTLYLEAASRNEKKKERTKIENYLSFVQGQLVDRQLELQNLQQKLHTLSVNSEIELLRTLDTPDFRKILEQVTTENFEEKVHHINEQLKEGHDKLLLRNIEASQNIDGQLQHAVDDTLEALKTLQDHSDSEEFKNKIKCIELEEVWNESITRCEEKLSQMENLTHLYASLEIDAKKIDAIPNPFTEDSP